jgi:hypothetical protein
MIVKREGRIGRIGIPARAAIKTCKHLVNYKAFHDINKEKLKLSYAGISFSKYMASRIGGGHVIYHGAEPAILPPVPKAKARDIFSLPQDKMIAVAIGFSTATKGWDTLAHRLPFVGSDLDFFKEFAEMRLGITAKRDPVSLPKQYVSLATRTISIQNLSIISNNNLGGNLLQSSTLISKVMPQRKGEKAFHCLSNSTLDFL